MRLLAAVWVAFILAGCTTDRQPVSRHPQIDDLAIEAARYQAAKSAYLNSIRPAAQQPVASVASIDNEDDPDSYLRSAAQQIEAEFVARSRPLTDLSEHWPAEDQVARMSKSARGQGILRLVHRAAECLALGKPLPSSADPATMRTIIRLPLILRFLRSDALSQAHQNHGSEAARDLSDAWNLSRLQYGRAWFVMEPKALEQMDLTLSEVARCAAILCPQIRPNPTLLARRFTWTPGSQTPTLTTMSLPVPPPGRAARPSTPQPVPSQFAQFEDRLSLEAGLPSLSARVQRVFADEGEIDTSDSQADGADLAAMEIRNKAWLARQFEFASAQRGLFERFDADPVGAGRALDQALAGLRLERRKSSEGLMRLARNFEELGRSRERLLQKRDVELVLLAAVRRYFGEGRWRLPPLPVPGVHLDGTQYANLNVVDRDPGCLVFRFDGLLPAKVTQQQPGAVPQQPENATVQQLFPPDETLEESEAKLDAEILSHRPVDDISQTAKLFPRVFQAYAKAGLPVPRREDSANISTGLLEGQDNVGQTTDLPAAPTTDDVREINRLLAENEKANNAGFDQTNVSDLFGPAVPTTTMEHTCCDRLVQIYCSFATGAAKSHQGLKAAQSLNSSWNALQILQREPPEFAVRIAGWEIERIAATIENCACTLDHDPVEFQRFETALGCNRDPLRRSDFLRAQICVMLFRAVTPAGSPTLRSDPLLANPDRLSPIAKANLVRVYQFWLDHADIVRSEDKGNCYKMLQVLEDLGKVAGQTGQSYDELKASAPMFSAWERPEPSYLLRDAELVLMKCIHSRLQTGRWPKTLGEIPGADPNHQWEILQFAGTFQIVPRPLPASTPQQNRPHIVGGAHAPGAFEQVCASDPPLALP